MTYKVVLAGFLVNLNLAAITVSLTPSVASPAPLGTLVNWSAAAADPNAGNITYSFRLRKTGGAFETVVDFGPNASLNWASLREGGFEVEVLAKNQSTGEIASSTSGFTLTPLVSGGGPVVTPTASPLVFIYSAPPCAAGSRMRVTLQSSDGTTENTSWQNCRGGYSMNFYLAGMRANTQYTATHTLDSGSAINTGPQVGFATADSGLQSPVVSILKERTAPPLDGILLQSPFGASAIATDLAGNIVWSGPSDITFLTRPDTDGRFLGIGEDGTKDISHQFFREFDLAGVTLAETNAARVNEQLAALGVHAISGFHHEARRLPNGGYLVLADSERVLTNVQGAGAVDVIGDTILVLDQNLRVTWTWDAFDHMDTSRAALLGETCTSAAGLACAPFYLAATANDWLHGNSLQLTPDGNILYSARHQDWVLKIDYEDGLGTGAILWRLGNQGDFQINSSDPNPWFSHQHDPNFERNGSTLTLFDDGNERAATDPNAHSRGQALVLDEQGRTAKLILNADLGAYSPAVGSAQKLSNGDYHFDSGFIADPSGNGALISQSIEVDAAGSMVYGIQIGEAEYRSFRMRDLYTAP